MAHVIHDVAADQDTVDWGPVPTMIEGLSQTRGRLLYQGPDGTPEAGFWDCTPGTWRCVVERDEFCHFLSGHCVYTEDSGERTELKGGDMMLFPAGWTGTCQVLETVRKVYMIR